MSWRQRAHRAHRRLYSDPGWKQCGQMERGRLGANHLFCHSTHFPSDQRAHFPLDHWCLTRGRLAVSGIFGGCTGGVFLVWSGQGSC